MTYVKEESTHQTQGITIREAIVTYDELNKMLSKLGSVLALP
jgi:hypothetical protein